MGFTLFDFCPRLRYLMYKPGSLKSYLNKLEMMYARPREIEQVGKVYTASITRGSPHSPKSNSAMSISAERPPQEVIECSLSCRIREIGRFFFVGERGVCSEIARCGLDGEGGG